MHKLNAIGCVCPLQANDNSLNFLFSSIVLCPYRVSYPYHDHAGEALLTILEETDRERQSIQKRFPSLRITSWPNRRQRDVKFAQDFKGQHNLRIALQPGLESRIFG